MIWILQAKNRRAAGLSAPARGLYFREVGYSSADLGIVDGTFSPSTSPVNDSPSSAATLAAICA